MLNTGANAIVNEAGGTLEANSGATLEIGSNVTNVNATSVIRANDGGTVELVGDTITGGMIDIHSTGTTTKLEIEGTVTLSATTTTTLSADAHNAIVAGTGDELPGATLVNHGTISGGGTIGDPNLTLDNYGHIVALYSTELVLDSGTNAIVNEAGGTLEANSGATLEIDSDVTNVNATTSIIRANNGGTVELVDDTITGGTIVLNGASAATKLEIEGTVTLSATTTTTLTNYSGNAIVSTHDEVPGAATLINYGTIRGAGTIGDGTSVGTDLTLDNYGHIIATGTSNALILDTGPTGTGNAIINETGGTLEANGGATLEIDSDVTNNGTIVAHGGGTVDLVNATVTDSVAGLVRVDVGGTMDLVNATVDNGTVINHGLLEATAGTNAIKNLASGHFTNDGTIEVAGTNSSLLLLNDTLNDFVGTQGGTIQVDGTADGSGAGSILNLQKTTIDGGGAIAHPAVFNIDGKLEATGISGTGTANIIKNFTAGHFTNDGELLVTGPNTGTVTSLLLLNDTLNDFVGTQGGTIQVVGTHDGSGAGSILNLQNTTINGGTYGIFNIDGLLKADGGAANPNIIENFDLTGPFTNDGEILVTGTNSSLLLLNDTLNDFVGTQGGTIQVDGTADGSGGGTSSTLELQNTTINGGTYGIFNIDGLLKADGGAANPNIIENFDLTGPFTNDGEILVTGTNSSLLLLNDTLNDFVGTQGGTIQVDGTADGSGGGTSSTLELQNTTINGGTYGIFNIDGLLKADGGAANPNIIENFDLTGPFTNDGEILVTGTNSSLLLLNDTLNDFVGTQGGTIQVDGTADGSGGGTSSTLELQNTTINGGTYGIFNIDGLLKADGGAANPNIIENFDLTGPFTNDGEILVTGTNSSLLLLNDTLNDFVGTQGGTIQVDGTADGSGGGTSSTLELQNTTINGGTYGIFNIDGLLKADGGAANPNIIENFDLTGPFTNDGEILVTGTNSSLLLLNDTLNDFVGTQGGTIQVDGTADGSGGGTSSTLELQNTTINGGTYGIFNIDGLLKADGGAANPNIIENFDLTGPFTNDGEILVTGTNSSLLLLNDTLNDFVGTQGGTIQVDGTADGSGGGTSSTLELQNTTINGGTYGIFNIDGLLKADGGAANPNIIENFDLTGPFTNDGEILVTGTNSSLLLLNDTLNDFVGTQGGTIQVDGTADGSGGGTSSTLELQNTTINGGTYGIFNIDGLLKADGGAANPNIIENFDLTGPFTNDGEILVTGTNSSLLLLNDTLNDFVGTQGGTIQVDGTADGSGGGTSSTLELQNTTINGGTYGIFNIDGLLKADGGAANPNIIENFDLTGPFTNDGEILVTGTNSSLLLLNDTLNDFVGTQGGTIQVDGTADGSGGGTSSTLELQNTTINGGTYGIFNIDGLLKADGGAANPNIIENFDLTGPFTNDGEILVTGTNSSLLLLNDTLNDFVGTQGGTIQVDGTADGSGGGTSSTLELQNTTINGGTYGIFNIDGLLKADGGAANPNIIENFDLTGPFTNDGEILVTGTNSSLLLLNDTLNDFVGTQGGTIQVDGTADGSGGGTSSTLELQNTTINGGTYGIFNIDGLLKADGGAANPNIIENFDLTGPFTNDGEILVTGTNSSLLLLNDTLNDFVGTQGGTIQVDASATLDLTNTNINGGIINNYGLIEGITAASFINSADIHNFGAGFIDANGVTLTIDPSTINNTGTLEAINGGHLVLSHDTVINIYDVHNGTVTTDASSTLELDATTITGGNVINHSVLEATGGGTSIISNVADFLDSTGEVFTNNGKLVVKDDGTTLILSNDKLENTFGSLSGKNGKVEVYARSDKYAAFVHAGSAEHHHRQWQCDQS